MDTTVSETQAAARALVQKFVDDPSSEKKAEYLSYLYTGFSIRESVALAGLQEWNPRRWRVADPLFAQYEQQAFGPDKVQLRREVLTNLFTRNLRRVFEKDAQVIEKSITAPEDMSKGDYEYLLRARSLYTPQQLQILEGVLRPGAFDGADISKLVLEAFSRTPDGTVKQARLSVET